MLTRILQRILLPKEVGQEKWNKKYRYWIPVLHINGLEVAKGRWGRGEVEKALEESNPSVK